MSSQSNKFADLSDTSDRSKTLAELLDEVNEKPADEPVQQQPSDDWYSSDCGWSDSEGSWENSDC